MRHTRRSFVKGAAASVLLVGGSGTRRAASATGLVGVPSLDGELLVDDTARREAATDFGRAVQRSPVAVLKPRSVADIARIVAYANTRGLKLAMRGRGHSLSGQAQAEGGIVIDSSMLSAVRWQEGDTLDAEPGAMWGDVAKTALARGRTPPVMPDAMMLSVRGMLSVGGTGETSYRSGAQVDHVLELDVVTGAGQLMTCSPERNGELFRMTLAGLGQCGIVVRARLRVVPAPRHVTIHTLTYDDVDGFLSDQERLATAEGLDLLAGSVTKDADGRWRLALLPGTFLGQPVEATSRPAWMTGLRFKTEAVPARMSYWDYLDRRTKSIAAGIASGRPNPSLAMVLPQGSTGPFLSHVLTTSEAAIGIWRIETFPMMTSRFTQPLHKISTGPIAFTLRLQRRASAQGAPDHEAMLAANRTLVTQMRAIGGKIYPPYAPIPSRAEWQEHYGPDIWPRFSAAKKRFDPNNVLTPGAGIF